MTTETTKPSVITAAEFVKGKYAKLVADGKCEVYSGNAPIRDVVPFAAGGAAIFFADDYYDFNEFTEEECVFDVRWLPPATPATDELASLRTANARYRAALEKLVGDTSSVAYLLTDALGGFNSLKWQEISKQYSLDDVKDAIKVARHELFVKAEIARAALAETEEA